MTPIVKKITIKAPVEKIWEALTDPEKLGDWTKMPANIKPEAGNEFTFKAGSMDMGDWDGIIRCKVKEVIKNKKISYTWATKGLFIGETLVSFELEEKDGATERSGMPP